MYSCLQLCTAVYSCLQLFTAVHNHSWLADSLLTGYEQLKIAIKKTGYQQAIKTRLQQAIYVCPCLLYLPCLRQCMLTAVTADSSDSYSCCDRLSTAINRLLPNRLSTSYKKHAYNGRSTLVYAPKLPCLRLSGSCTCAALRLSQRLTVPEPACAFPVLQVYNKTLVVS